jgi:hypothetical protein
MARRHDEPHRPGPEVPLDDVTFPNDVAGLNRRVHVADTALKAIRRTTPFLETSLRYLSGGEVR